MSGAETTPAGVCYRHPDRESWVLCQRCGRTICPRCQTQAAVGVQCPDCVREGRAATRPSPGRRVRSVLRPRRGAPVVTYSLIGATVFVYLLQLVTGGALTRAWLYIPILTVAEPWRMVTSVFLHAPLTGSLFALLHILFNMYILMILGSTLEPVLGRARFLALYLISGFAGSVGVLWLASPLGGVLGASGAVFGLFGAYFIVLRSLGRNGTQILVIVGLNFVLGFFIGSVSWQAHLGGLVVGALIGLIFTRTRGRQRRGLQAALLSAVVVGLIALSALRVLTG